MTVFVAIENGWDIYTVVKELRKAFQNIQRKKKIQLSSIKRPVEGIPKTGH